LEKIPQKHSAPKKRYSPLVKKSWLNSRIIKNACAPSSNTILL